MEQTLERKKSPFYKRKMLMIPAVFLLSAFMVAAAIISTQVVVNIIVPEPFSLDVEEFNLEIYPGASQTEDVVLTNSGSAELHANLIWVEDSNPNEVDYEVTITNNDVNIASEGTHTFTVMWSISGASEVGSIDGHLEVERTSAVPAE